MLIGGCIHYPRAHYTEWPHLFQEAKLQGINLLETYVFWDIHEPSQGQFYFPDYPSSANLVDFLRQAQEQGLYVHLRFGPYVCAEWNYGGLPVWLRELGNGTSIFRTTDSYWMNAMTSFIDKTIEVVRDAQLFAEDGGPIVMVQIENEYGNIEATYGDEGAKYVAEVADYALKKNLDVPWVMCQQGEGVGTAPPGEIINACNGHYCDNWISQVSPPFLPLPLTVLLLIHHLARQRLSKPASHVD
jgi:beta-galactosidase GanA